MAGDVPPVMAHTSPLIQAKKSFRMRPKRRVKRAVESILGEEENRSLIPKDAEKVLSDDESDKTDDPDNKSPIDKPGHEALLTPALAIVAPDLTPDADKELDPSLVPNYDPAIAAVLGDPPPKPVTIAAEQPKPKTNESNEMGLPVGEMPRPPGTFLRSMASYLGESGDVDKPKIELTSKVAISPGLDGNFGHQGEMPRPQPANTEETMRAFRRFHPIKTGPVNL